MFGKRKQLPAVVEMLQKQLAEKESELTEKESELESAKRHQAAIQKQHAQELEDANKRVNELLPKLIKVTAYRLYNAYPKYRVAVDIHDDMIRGFCLHGDSRDWLRYMARWVGHEVERELATINFVRFKEERRPIFERGGE